MQDLLDFKKSGHPAICNSGTTAASDRKAKLRCQHEANYGCGIGSDGLKHAITQFSSSLFGRASVQVEHCDQYCF